MQIRHIFEVLTALGSIQGATATRMRRAAVAARNATNSGIPAASPAASTPSAASPATSSSAPADPNAFTVHPDGDCQQPLKAGAVSVLNNTAKFPSLLTTSKPAFFGAEAQGGGGGWNVWFGMNEAPSGCRNLVLIPFDAGRPSPGYPAGKEVVNAGGAGCYFANIPANTDIYTSQCCGQACMAANLNSSLLISAPSKRSEDNKPQPDEARKDLEKKSQRQPAVKESQSDVAVEERSNSGSAAAQAGEKVRRFFYSSPPCKLSPTTWFPQFGEQTVVTNGQRCAGGPSQPCTISVNQAISYSTTATSDTSQTFTTTFGAEVGFKTGLDILGMAEAEVSGSFHTDFSNAITQATGQQVSESNTTTLTYTLPVVLGNGGALTFTPMYNCSMGPLDCGHGESQPLTVCQPIMGTDGKSIVGEYSVVTYG